MKLKQILFFIFVSSIFSGSVLAQFDDMYYHLRPDSLVSSRTEVGLYSDYLVNSNAVTGDFFNKFYSTGGHIDNDLKDLQASHLKGSNRIGADLNSGFYFLYKPAKKNLGISIGIRDRSHFDARFSDDLYNVAFYGNKSYAGRTANMGNFEMNLLRYQQFQVGVVWAAGDTASKIGIALSFMRGEQNIFLSAPVFDLYTAADGSYIDMKTSMKFNRTDTANRGLGAYNGSGTTFDLFFEAPFKTKYGRGKIRLNVSDVGFITWNSNSLTYSKDSTYHYDGFKVNNLFDLQGNTFKSVNQDSIVKSLVKTKKQTYTTNIPSIINLSAYMPLGPKFGMAGGVRYVFFANYTTYFYLKPSIKIGGHIILSVNAGYGGYGGLSYGIETAIDASHGFILLAGSNNMEGWLSPSSSLGQSAFLRIAKKF